jgi:hypothetical protein
MKFRANRTIKKRVAALTNLDPTSSEPSRESCSEACSVSKEATIRFSSDTDLIKLAIDSYLEF